MTDRFPEEAKNFKLLGHDASAAWGGGSLVEVKNGFAYVGAVGGSSFNGAGRLHRPRRVAIRASRTRSPNSARRPACIATSCGWSATTCST